MIFSQDKGWYKLVQQVQLAEWMNVSYVIHRYWLLLDSAKRFFYKTIRRDDDFHKKKAIPFNMISPLMSKQPDVNKP